MLAQGNIADVVTAWSLGDGDTIEPDARVDAAAVRSAYRARIGDEQ